TPGKKALQGGLLLLLLGLAGAGLVDRVTPLAGLTADYQTATGERKTVELTDGSLLTLNARSAVDIQFSSGQRRVRLREEVLSGVEELLIEGVADLAISGFSIPGYLGTEMSDVEFVAVA
ncbi:FecR domain-containing protein, partial [Salmonella enterica subsp. enterica]